MASWRARSGSGGPVKFQSAHGALVRGRDALSLSTAHRLSRMPIPFSVRYSNRVPHAFF